MCSVIVADDAYYLAEWYMFPLKLTAPLIMRKHRFTETSWVKIWNMSIRQFLKIVTSICYFKASLECRDFSLNLCISITSAGRGSGTPTRVRQCSFRFIHQKYYERAKKINNVISWICIYLLYFNCTRASEFMDSCCLCGSTGTNIRSAVRFCEISSIFWVTLSGWIKLIKFINC